MRHTSTSHVTHLNKFCHTHSRVLSPNVQRTNHFQHTPIILTLIIFNSRTPARATSHVTHINESCHTHQRVMSRDVPRTSTSHVTHINETRHGAMPHTDSAPIFFISLPHSCKSLLPLEWLHLKHAATTLSHACLPPLSECVCVVYVYVCVCVCV